MMDEGLEERGTAKAPMEVVEDMGRDNVPGLLGELQLAV
jgi:hypothetical protein